MNRREASKEETRKLILKAARKLLAEEGGEECTIKDIAQEAGVSPASVVVHFKNKTGLLEEALHGDIEETLRKLMSTMPQSASLLPRLMHMGGGFLKFYAGNRNLYRVLLRNTVYEPVNETPHMTKQAEQFIQYIVGMVDEEKTRGTVRQDVDSSLAAVSIFSLYLGALSTLFRLPEMTADMITHMLYAMTSQFLQGITGGGK